MTVYRPEPPDLKEMDVEINKKGGKEIGLSFAECKDNGIYVLDIVSDRLVLINVDDLVNVLICFPIQSDGRQRG